MGKKNNDAQVAATNAAIQEQREARARLDAVNEPDYSEIEDYIRAAAAENPELLGLFEAIERDPSALEDIVNDPQLRETQIEALESLRDAGESGFSAGDMAERRELQRDVNANEQARQASILQQMAQQGRSGSGAELAARLSSSQESAQRAAEASDRLAMDSSTARRQALQQAAQAAGSLRQQDRAEQTQVASAKDQIAQFNAMNRQNVNNQNLQLRQGMENQRSAQQQQMYGNLGNLQQQQFANQMQKAGAYVNATQPIAQMTAQNVRQEQGPLGTIGALAGAGLAAYASGGNPQATMAGGQFGGSLGNSMQSNNAARFADGGLKGPNRHYSEIMRDKKINKELEKDLVYGGDRYQQSLMGKPNISTEEAYSAGKQQLGELGDRIKNLIKPSESPTESKPEMPKKDSGSSMMGGMSALASALKSQESQPKSQPMQLDSSPVIDTSSLGKLASQKLIAADGGVKEMAYNDGGMGTIIDSGEESYAGDMLEDRINDGEMVLNLEQQDRINDKLMELKRLKSSMRTDTMVNEGDKDVNRNQQDSLLAVARGEMDVEELPNERIVGEPTGGMGELLALLKKPKRS